MECSNPGLTRAAGRAHVRVMPVHTGKRARGASTMALPDPAHIGHQSRRARVGSKEWLLRISMACLQRHKCVQTLALDRERHAHHCDQPHRSQRPDRSIASRRQPDRPCSSPSEIIAAPGQCQLVLLRQRLARQLLWKRLILILGLPGWGGVGWFVCVCVCVRACVRVCVCVCVCVCVAG